MEYSPLMLALLWALTPSSVEGFEQLKVPAAAPLESPYFTFNDGKPFIAERDPQTGALPDLRTTPLQPPDEQDDYYEEVEEEDGIDRKDGPKIFTRNDIASNSKEPEDLHKFLNLPVKYSSSDKFPLISSSYANMKVQGHNAGAYASNHRPASSSPAPTISPSYYPLRTTAAPSTITITSTTPPSTTTTPTTTTMTTTTTTTTRPPSTTTPNSKVPTSTIRTTSTNKPPPTYEYEYDYDYDKEPEQDKKSTTQKILEFFEKDYAFLGASEEQKHNKSKVEYVLPSASLKPTEPEPVTVSSNSGLYIPPEYLKPKPTPNTTESQGMPTNQQNKTIVTPSTVETKTSTTEPPTTTPYKKEIQTVKSDTIDEENTDYWWDFGQKAPSKPVTDTTTPKLETTTKSKEEKVPFFPTTSPKIKETTVPEKPDEEKVEEIPEKTEQKPFFGLSHSSTTESKVEVSTVKPMQFHHPYLKPQDIPTLQNTPPEPPRPYNPYQQQQHQRPYLTDASVPPEMKPPQKPVDPHYYVRTENPSTGIYNNQNRPFDPTPFTPNRPQNTNPTGFTANKPTGQFEGQVRPQYTPRPTDQKPIGTDYHPYQQKPPMTDMKGQENHPRPESGLKQPTRVDSTNLPNTRPYDGLTLVPYKPEAQHTKQTDYRPQEVPQRPPTRPASHPSDHVRYPPLPLNTLRPQPEQRPQTQPQESSSKIPDFNSNRQEIPMNNNNYQVQFSQPSKVENHFIKVSPGQENPSYSLQTSFSIGVPPPAGGEESGPKVGPKQPVGQVLFPDEAEKTRPASPTPPPPPQQAERYPRPPWESHLKPPQVFTHHKKEPYPFKRPKPTRPDLPNILPQFRPNAKIGQAGPPQEYLHTPYEELRPPPLPRPQFLRGEPSPPPVSDFFLETEDTSLVHRRNGMTTRPLTGPTNKRSTLRSEDEKTDPVFVVYPTNNAQDGVVVGTRGSQRPLPPQNLDIDDSFPLDNNKNFQSRVDTPILKGKPTTKPIIKNEFPYPLVKPTEISEEKTTTTTEKVTKEYTAFSPTVPPAEKEHDTEINVIPNLQDYMPFATKKPIEVPSKWNVGEDPKPISTVLKTQKPEEPRPELENHKTGNDPPRPEEFQAPFHASLSAPSQGWSVVRPRPDPQKETETTTMRNTDEAEGKFDIQNFKPQLFGGFQPIIPPVEGNEDKNIQKNEKQTR